MSVTAASVVSRGKAEYERVSGGFGVRARGCRSSDGVRRGVRGTWLHQRRKVMGGGEILMANGKRKTCGCEKLCDNVTK